MTNKQFNLSDHITNKSHSSGNIPVVRVEEFIILLKKEMGNTYNYEDGFLHISILKMREIIDKLAGDKLVK